MNGLPRKQRHATHVEALSTVTDERLAALIAAIDKTARDSQSSLAALRREQRRRRKQRSQAPQ